MRLKVISKNRVVSNSDGQFREAYIIVLNSKADGRPRPRRTRRQFYRRSLQFSRTFSNKETIG